MSNPIIPKLLAWVGLLLAAWCLTTIDLSDRAYWAPAAVAGCGLVLNALFLFGVLPRRRKHR